MSSLVFGLLIASTLYALLGMISSRITEKLSGGVLNTRWRAIGASLVLLIMAAVASQASRGPHKEKSGSNITSSASNLEPVRTSPPPMLNAPEDQKELGASYVSEMAIEGVRLGATAVEVSKKIPGCDNVRNFRNYKSGVMVTLRCDSTIVRPRQEVKLDVHLSRVDKRVVLVRATYAAYAFNESMRNEMFDEQLRAALKIEYGEPMHLEITPAEIAKFHVRWSEAVWNRNGATTSIGKPWNSQNGHTLYMNNLICRIQGKVRDECVIGNSAYDAVYDLWLIDYVGLQTSRSASGL